MPSTRRKILVLLSLVALLAAGSVLAACGSDDDGGGGGDDVASILKSTFGSDKPVRSGKLDVAVSLDAKGLPSITGPIALKLAGPFQSNGKDTLPGFDFDLSLNASGQSFTAGAVSTGEKGFLTFQDQNFAIGDELFTSFKTGYQQAQKESGDAEGGPTFQALGIDPLRWLGGAKDAGSQDVGGTATTHITATIDVPKFLVDINTLLAKADDLGVAGQAPAQVPTTLTEKQRAQIAEAVKSAKVDVYSGEDDKLLRRLAVELTFDVPQASRQDAGGLQSGTLRLDLTIADLNEKQTISAPENARPLEELTSQLGGGGGAGAATGAAGAAAPDAPTGDAGPASEAGGASGGSPAANPEYLECLDAAGTDLAKVQECATALSR